MPMTSQKRLQLGSVISVALCLLILSLVWIQADEGSRPGELWKGLQNSLRFKGTKDKAVSGADGLSGDFLPEHERRASHGALVDQGTKALIRDNLRKDKHYLISFPVAGWNNQVICMLHLIYFALRSKRIPIVPDFTPHGYHLRNESAPLLRFGEVFDLPRLSALIETPIVEMSELKQSEFGEQRTMYYDEEFGAHSEEIGKPTVDEKPALEILPCWSWGKSARNQEPQLGWHYSLDFDNVPLPKAVVPGHQKNLEVKPFIELLKPGHAPKKMDEWQLELIKNNSLLTPESLVPEDIACVDEIYFLEEESVSREYGDTAIVSGVRSWNEVGRYMYFAPKLRALAHGFVRRAFGLDENDKIPSYIAVHIRRTDFAPDMASMIPLDYAVHVAEILDTTKNFLGYTPERVLVCTDETDPVWLESLRELGWSHIDHAAEQTALRYGPWYETLIDGVALSEGVGFVGLHHSTMAALAYQRVRTWHGGPGRLIWPNERAPQGYVYPYGPESM